MLGYMSKKSYVTVDGKEVLYTCTDFIKDCLRGKNKEKCKQYLLTPSFWDDVAKEIDDMLPPIAISMFQAFEFTPYEEFSDTAQRKLKKVQSVDDWLTTLVEFTKTVPPKLTTQEVTVIGASTKLIHCLRLLVKKLMIIQVF